MSGLEYGAVDWQLLFELRVSLLRDKPLTLPLLRIMRERGWISIPPPDEWVRVRAVLEDEGQETIEAFSYDLAHPQLLPVGERELALYAREYDDALIETILAEEMDGFGDEDFE